MKNHVRKKDFTIKCLIFLLILWFVSAAIPSGICAQQVKPLTIKKNNATLEEILSYVEKEMQVVFLYADKDVDLSQKVTINLRNSTLVKVLDEVFKNTPNTYKIDGKQIYITKKTIANESKSDRIVVIGKVSDGFGETIPGVSVFVRGTALGTTTDKNGEFTIAVPSDTCVLGFSFLGYQTENVKVGNKRVIAVVLKETVENLDEVVVVAFGRQKKESVISSIQTVNMKDLKIPGSNLTTAFAGKIPGIISYQTTGEPGADNAQFFVRGVTTFGYKASPLILIDGFEAEANDLARMQPDDIESFSILKDASATALYGPRGANGIITVNTKTGKEGILNVNARVDFNMATPTRTIDLMDGVSYMKLYNEAYRNRNIGDANLIDWYSQQKIQSTGKGEFPMLYPNVDWYEELFNRQTYNTKANINVSGGSKTATYYVAGGFDHETGLLKVDKTNNFNSNIDINRFHIRSNVIFRFTKNTSLDTRIQGRFERYNGPARTASDIFNRVMWSNPVDFPPVFAPDPQHANTSWTLFGTTMTGGDNPYAEMVKGYTSRDDNTITAQATLMQDLGFIVSGLKTQLKASINIWSNYSATRTFNPYFYAIIESNPITGEYLLKNTNNDGYAYLGDIQPVRDSEGHYYFEGRINWDREFGKHSLGLMTVGIMEEYVLDGANGSIYASLPERNVGNSTRFTYDYNRRYYLELAYGFHGSEKFGADNRYGFFPTAGLGWVVSNESFWENIKNKISNLKLKLTYGQVGNDAIAGREGRFYFLSEITIGSNNDGWTTPAYWGQNFSRAYGGYAIDRQANPNIGWEVSTKANIGLELGLFKNEDLKFQIDFYRDIRDRIYMLRSHILSASLGLTSEVGGNIGRVQSQGIDTSLDYSHSFNKDCWMTGRANLTYAVNEYVYLDEINYKDKYRSKKGQNINQNWGLIAERLFVSQAEINESPQQTFGGYYPGDIKYKDINSDNVIDEKDMIPIGYPWIPEIQYGFGLSSGYKKWDMSFFFQGNARSSLMIDAAAITPFAERRNALQVIVNNYYSETNPDLYAFWPRLSDEISGNNTQSSTWWLRDGSFLRLKSVELGYNWDKLSKHGLKNFRVYFSAENLFYISPFKLWDPEMRTKDSDGNVTGLANGLTYPLNRRFNVGVLLNF
ncbi:MAG: TonB-dependent receptor [Dysgonamonadaceae bacterium]|jgi:TonB-linked SusC/RagA family outer membrane protein|nr:TonB-dependent receptor [Dysgonamonadaceae bacterium]